MKQIDGIQFKNMLLGGLSALKRNMDRLNQLNVFPVPDADTGTNMVITLEECFRLIGRNETTVSAVATVIAKNVTLNSRGNSGTILSQFFKGFATVLSLSDTVDGATLCRALRNGVDRAYRSVPKPVEGTMLTVMRVATEAAETEGSALPADKLVRFFATVANDALQETKNMLPALQHAGVIDSGAAGLVCFFEGAANALEGKFVEESSKAVNTVNAEDTPVDYSLFDRNTDFSLGYCTEFLLQLKRRPSEDLFIEIREGLAARGTSLVSSLEGDKFKAHIHTGQPESVLSFMHDFGEFLSLKIENMSVQHLRHVHDKITVGQNAGAAAFSVCVLAATDEEKEIALELGADFVITDNGPDLADELREVLRRLQSQKLLLFPNGDNNLRMAKKIAGGKPNVAVIDSTSFAGCFAAMTALDYEKDFDATVSDAGAACAGAVVTTLIPPDGEGPAQLAENAVMKMLADDPNAILVFFIHDARDTEAVRSISEGIKTRFPFCEISVMYVGGNTRNAELMTE